MDHAKPKFSLSEADYVDIAEERTDWVRVRSGQSEGWVPRSALMHVW